jgi:hypothetical protein
MYRRIGVCTLCTSERVCATKRVTTWHVTHLPFRVSVPRGHIWGLWSKVFDYCRVSCELYKRYGATWSIYLMISISIFPAMHVKSSNVNVIARTTYRCIFLIDVRVTTTALACLVSVRIGNIRAILCSKQPRLYIRPWIVRDSQADLPRSLSIARISMVLEYHWHVRQETPQSVAH